MQALSKQATGNPDIPPKLGPLLVYLESLTERVDLKKLEELLRSVEISAQDVSSVVRYHEGHYMRNLVSSSDWYDLLVICWRPGQRSAIHDHTDSSCGFKIIDGTSTEIVYEKTGRGLYVTPVSERQYQQGEVCLAEDSAIHHIANESAKDNLITLHIYSPPLKMSNYEVERFT